jgi:hypothetical protein
VSFNFWMKGIAMITPRKFLLALGLAIFCAIPRLALTQGAQKPSGAVQIEAKRAELQQIREQLSDPDADRRAAAMMVIVESGDASKIQFALRIALTSDDAFLRNIGFRAYLATVQQLSFDVQSPPDIQRQVDAALANDPERLAELLKRYPYLKEVAQSSYQVHFFLKNYNMSKGAGAATVRGREVSLTSPVIG